MKPTAWLVGAVAIALGAIVSLGGCSSPIPNRNPLGEPFPAIEATALDAETENGGAPVAIPGDFAGAPVLLMVGFVQDTQFDIDRWLFGVLDAGLEVALREVPAARGMGARLASGFIDGGMRRGIPKAEWGAVVTTYGKTADTIAEFTGTESPRNARVLLLDSGGVVRWFHDQGFSAPSLLDLRTTLSNL